VVAPFDTSFSRKPSTSTLCYRRLPRRLPSPKLQLQALAGAALVVAEAAEVEAAVVGVAEEAPLAEDADKHGRFGVSTRFERGVVDLGQKPATRLRAINRRGIITRTVDCTSDRLRSYLHGEHNDGVDLAARMFFMVTPLAAGSQSNRREATTERLMPKQQDAMFHVRTYPSLLVHAHRRGPQSCSIQDAKSAGYCQAIYMPVCCHTNKRICKVCLAQLYTYNGSYRMPSGLA